MEEEVTIFHVRSRSGGACGMGKYIQHIPCPKSSAHIVRHVLRNGRDGQTRVLETAQSTLRLGGIFRPCIRAAWAAAGKWGPASSGPAE